jgi:hypothetical protein
MAWTAQGKAVALAKLAERRASNKPLPPDYNSTLPAYSPMFYNCIGCNEVLSLPEDWKPPRRELCTECEALRVLGWLE